MKKLYNKPTVSIVKIGMQPLMTLSQNDANPQTEVNHEEYNEEFSSRRRQRSVWDDDEEYEDY